MPAVNLLYTSSASLGVKAASPVLTNSSNVEISSILSLSQGIISPLISKLILFSYIITYIA